MSEQTKESIVQQQAKARPKIEDIIPQYFDGEAKQSLTEFLEYCRANKITTPWSATNRWKIKLKSEGIGMIYIGKSPCLAGGENFEKNTWYIHVNMESEYAEKENLSELIHRNILPCQRGRKNCNDTMRILGKEIEGACPESGRRFANPDAETLACIKKWLEFKVKNISV